MFHTNPPYTSQFHLISSLFEPNANADRFNKNQCQNLH